MRIKLNSDGVLLLCLLTGLFIFGAGCKCNSTPPTPVPVITDPCNPSCNVLPAPAPSGGCTSCTATGSSTGAPTGCFTCCKNTNSGPGGAQTPAQEQAEGTCRSGCMGLGLIGGQPGDVDVAIASMVVNGINVVGINSGVPVNFVPDTFSLLPWEVVSEFENNNLFSEMVLYVASLSQAQRTTLNTKLLNVSSQRWETASPRIRDDMRGLMNSATRWADIHGLNVSEPATRYAFYNSVFSSYVSSIGGSTKSRLASLATAESIVCPVAAYSFALRE